MIDCEKCKYYHKDCESRFRCRVDVDEIKAESVKEFADWLVKYKVVGEGAMQELIRDFKGECGNG